MNSIRLNEHLIQSNPIESMQFNGGKGADWKLLFRLERVQSLEKERERERERERVCVSERERCGGCIHNHIDFLLSDAQSFMTGVA